MPVRHFFREPAAFTRVEKVALDHCRGYVLDVGAGTGLHSLALQARGLRVTAIDVSDHAVKIMTLKGVVDVQRADLFEYDGGPFDTVLMLGNGIGMVETLAGLDRFLRYVSGFLTEGGQVLLDSTDVRSTDDRQHLAYQDANRQAGRYIGEIRMQLGFRETRGPMCGSLHVDPETLQVHASAAGWQCDVLLREPSGSCLARLVLRHAAIS
jgi:2-polyprenyl-3-methyl-5-hydroxy-6-metoxy-1,4-benzoquinol methylase